MKTFGLFAGIGGFELGFAASGHEPSGFCEILPTARAVLEARFPGVPITPDVRHLSTIPRETELVAAGFPCQDLSQAGRTRGLDGSQSGLIHEVFRLLRKSRCPWVVIENVPFMLQLRQGHAMISIIDELERLGYRWAYRVVDTFGFALPQRRERVFIVATNAGDPSSVLLADDNPLPRPQTAIGNIAHGFYWTEGRGGLGWAPDAVPTLKNGSTIGIPSPPAVLFPNGGIVKPDLKDAERLQGFPVNWTEAAESVARGSSRWALVGSAVSVPVADWIGRRLVQSAIYDQGRDRAFPLSGKLPRAARGDIRARHAVDISPDPIGAKPIHLARFLRHAPAPLSARATAGFLSRTRSASLRFPEGFISAVERHLVQVQRDENLVLAA